MNDENKSDLALIKRDVVDVVTQRIGELVGDGKLHLPENFSAENALMAAWLKLQSTVDKSGRPALAVCTKDSIANALLDMICQGLTPGKDQIYFVVYGNKLVALRSYFGDIALLKRAYPGYEVYAETVFKGDVVEYEIIRGKRFISKHTQKFENIGKLDKILGAYAVIYDEEGEQRHCEIMTIEQIKNAWSQGQNWPPREGKKSAHQNFPEEFCKKSVIARACKRLINSSNDSYLVKAVERQNHMAAEAEMEARVLENGNQEVIDLPAQSDEPGQEPEQQPTEPEESPSSPTARFNDFVDEHNLNPTKARKIVATIRKAKDARNLGNADYEAILGNADAFLASYQQQHGANPTFAEPGF